MEKAKMNDDFKELKLRSGYSGEDSMRRKAEKILGDEFARIRKEFPESFSAPEREKVRLFKKGGHVDKSPKIHSLTKEQSDLVLPHHRKGEYSGQRSLTEAQAMKNGGDVRVKTPKLSIQSMGEAEKMKKGGYASYHKAQEKELNKLHGSEEKKIRKMHKDEERGMRKIYASGGHINYEKDMRGERNIKSPRKITPSKHSGEFDASYGQYKEQGKSKGGAIKRAHGGSINYESGMKGMNPKAQPRSVKPKEMGFDATYGEYKEQGRKAGGIIKRAAGGAAKVRKGMMTKSGNIIR